MTLKQSIADDAVTVFCNSSEFAETVTYYPYQYPGDAARDPRSIVAVVIREQLSSFGEDGSEAVLPVYQVHVANDSTNGIAGDELDLGGDQIALPPRDGETAERKSITQLLTQDNGMLVLECR